MRPRRLQVRRVNICRFPAAGCSLIPRPTISLDSDLRTCIRSDRRGGTRYVQTKEWRRWGREGSPWGDRSGRWSKEGTLVGPSQDAGGPYGPVSMVGPCGPPASPVVHKYLNTQPLVPNQGLDSSDPDSYHRCCFHSLGEVEEVVSVARWSVYTALIPRGGNRRSFLPRTRPPFPPPPGRPYPRPHRGGCCVRPCPSPRIRELCRVGCRFQASGMPEYPGTPPAPISPPRDRRSRRLWGIRNGRLAQWSPFGPVQLPR